MKALHLLIAFSCFITLSSHSLTAQTFFEKEFKPGFSFEKLLENPDGSISIAGTGHNLDKIGLMQVSPIGDSLWMQTFSTSTQYKFKDAIRAQNGDYLLLAGTFDPVQLRDWQTIIRCDNSGSLLWKQDLQDSVNSYNPKNLFELSDGSLVVWGNIDTTAISGGYPYFMRLDSAGNSQSRLNFRSLRRIIGGIEMSDGGYALHTGQSVNIPQGYLINLPIVYRIDPQISLQWTWASQDTLPTSLSGMTESPDGGLYLAGSNNNTYLPVTEPGYIAQVSKLDNNGNQEWLHRQQISTWNGENSSASRVVANGSGGYTFMGGTQSYQTSNNSMVLASSDSSGQLLWDREFRIAFTLDKDMIRMADGGYALSCNSYDFQNAVEVLIRTNPLGVEREPLAESNSFQVHPNPNSGIFWLKFSDTQSGTLSLYDFQGKLHLRQEMKAKNSLRVKAEGLAPGLYLLNVQESSGKQQVQRVLIH